MNEELKTPPILEATAVTKQFTNTVALDDVSLTVNQSEAVCLLGPNGAGKTTLINIFLGFLQPDAGNVQVCGINPMSRPREARSRMSYIPESMLLYPDLTAVQNLEVFDSFLKERHSKQELFEMLSNAGLESEFHDAKAKTLSKGMRQKVALAIALSKRADVILMDEPLSGLDPVSAREFTEEIVRLRERGVTMLLASHDIFHVTSLATRIGMLKAGKLLELLDMGDMTAEDVESLYLSRMRGN